MIPAGAGTNRLIPGPGSQHRGLMVRDGALRLLTMRVYDAARSGGTSSRMTRHPVTCGGEHFVQRDKLFAGLSHHETPRDLFGVDPLPAFIVDVMRNAAGTTAEQVVGMGRWITELRQVGKHMLDRLDAARPVGADRPLRTALDPAADI